LLTSLGSRFEWAPVTPRNTVASAVQSTLVQISQPFSSASAPAPVASATDWASVAIFGIWVCGIAAVIVSRCRGWCRIRAAILSSRPITIPAPIEIRSAPGLLEPGVVGVLRPILLLPAGITERLQPPEFEAVLAHELCHFRRHDNLTSAIHMIVEAVFWFHPLVWWIGARLIQERERACDEAVLNLGSKPHDYAEGILKVCKSYVESPLSCVSGVTSSDLKKRIQAILTGRVAGELTFAKKLALGVAAAAAITIPVSLGIMGMPRMQAQSHELQPKFEAASVKSCEAFSNGHSLELAAETFRSECTTLERLIEQAYGLFGNGRMDPGSSLMVIGGPAWTMSDLYEIEAKAQGPQSRAMMNGPMLQALLEDRFGLKFHREVRDVPVYALTVGDRGLKLQPFEGTCIARDFDKPPSDADCGTASAYGNGFRLKGATMADLCAGFSVLLDRRVIDKTGIGGRFNVYVDLSAEDPGLLNHPRSLAALSDPIAAPFPPILFSAAETAMKNLGLNLEASKGPGEFFVIDHIERPI
ncbi:MAG: TIGR03435 family protein, partial [Acidobacteriaceae bacterium]|nr:TIGR03435 family protein [Acidobacteriaceae bacterium]